LNEWDAGDDPGFIPPRQWLLGNQFCRGFISSIVAAGGVGKSALRLLQFISLASGQALCGQHVFHRSRVLIISLEDDRNEMQRRIKAALDYYHGHCSISRADLKNWLFCATPKLSKIAMLENRKRVIGPLDRQIRDAIERCKPDIISLDPFVKIHAMSENDSGDMDFVCDLLLTIGSEYNLAVDSPHHVHKGFMTPGDADSGRGPTGIRDAGRLVYTLVPMSSEEAQMLGIDETRRKLYVRLDPAKINITVHAAGAAWFQLHGQPIGNGTDRPRCRPIRRCSPQSALWSMAKAQSTQRPCPLPSCWVCALPP
jgi:RecA-family ATPase